MSSANQFPVVERKRFPWGCLIGGCLTVVLVMMICVGAVGYMGYSYYIGQVNKYTSSEPADIPKIEKTKEEADAVKKRIEDFKTALERNEVQEPFVLTADDINTMISTENEFKGKMFVTIADGEISAQASIPTDMIPGGKGRYFNGKVSLKASLENGVLIVTLDEAEVNGESIPSPILEAIRKENLAKDAYKDAKSAEFLRKFESLIIENDKIILTPAPVKPKKSETEEK
jgi:hypothetical protein